MYTVSSDCSTCQSPGPGHAIPYRYLVNIGPGQLTSTFVQEHNESNDGCSLLDMVSKELSQSSRFEFAQRQEAAMNWEIGYCRSAAKPGSRSNAKEQVQHTLSIIISRFLSAAIGSRY